MVISALLEGMNIVIHGPDADRVHQQGWFGQKIKDKLFLSPYEALHLQEREIIQVKDSQNQSYSNDSLTSHFEKQDPQFWTNYLVYKDLKSRGYHVRTGESQEPFFFRLYQRGENPKTSVYHYLVAPMREGKGYSLKKLDYLVNYAKQVRKQCIIALVDSLGDVAYVQATQLSLKSLPKKPLTL